MDLHHISAYHPQSNVLVECFHCSLKAILHSRHSSPAWSDKLPWVMLGLRTTPKADLDMSSTKLALQHPPLLPGKLIRRGVHTMPVPALPTRHHCVCPHSAGPALDSTEHAFVGMDSHWTPLQSPYHGPCKVISHSKGTHTGFAYQLSSYGHQR